MTFKTEAEVYRYLLEKEGNVAVNDEGTIATFVDGLLVTKTVDEITPFSSRLSIGAYAEGWRPLEKKEWWEVAEPSKLLVWDSSGSILVWTVLDKDGFTPFPSSTIREWLAEAERVERECNL